MLILEVGIQSEEMWEEEEEKVGGRTKRRTSHFNSQGFVHWKL